MVILDDDTILPPASLGALVAGLERAEVTTGLPRYYEDGRWPSRLLAQFVANNAATTYLSLGELSAADHPQRHDLGDQERSRSSGSGSSSRCSTA